MNDKKIFWLDGFEGKARGGFFVRNPLVEFFSLLEQNGHKPVGISYDGSRNLEIIVEDETDENQAP